MSRRIRWQEWSREKSHGDEQGVLPGWARLSDEQYVPVFPWRHSDEQARAVEPNRH
ncbi:hypothetical protein [Desulfotomaculum copahuensis]|uniref:hypothetical protein n=1 Tax=Desulfotomaculum copahuensis TaxID=1838280 RepID=UPI001372A971|nr:hypothetical protein [Desulfotomaculum copahuensis]